MTRSALMMFLLALITATGAAAKPDSATRSPNVIFILTDDQGYYDLGCYGATEVETPRIDALATEGMRFTDYYAAAPICSPSRVGIMTGSYPRRVGNEAWVHRADSRTGIHADELTMAELFKSKGYATACIGKWHMGFHEPFLPKNQGFDHYYGLLHNLDPVETVYFEDEGGVPLVRNAEVIQRPVNPADLTRLYTDEAIRFIEEKKNAPFFIYLPHTMLHVPLGVSNEFKGTSKWGEYGDAIQELDHHVGRIVDTLKQNKLDKNTIVIYASDNGRGPGRSPTQKLQGRKLTTFEAGIRVPAIAWGPGVGIKPGQESAAVVHAMDWYPSLATLAGIKIPQGPVIDGRDLSPLLRGRCDDVPKIGVHKSLNGNVPLRRPYHPDSEWGQLMTQEEYRNAFFYHGSEGALSAVRWRNWKLYLNPSISLYDLEADPGETKKVRNPEINRKLRGMAITFQEEMRRYARPAGEVPPPIDPKSRTQIPAEIQASLNVRKDITYARYGERTLEMDVYRPKTAWGKLPAIICIHGGGWAKGNRTSHATIAQALAARGFVAATISYRLSGEAQFPAAIHDCKAAVRFLRANADAYGIDADYIGAMGSSAGGHLTALLASSPDVPELEGNGGNPGFSSAIQAAIPMGAQTDFLSARNKEISAKRDIWKQFMGGSQIQQPQRYRLASPLTHLSSKSAPTWLISGELDDPSTHADAFRKKLSKLGIDNKLHLLKDAPHGFANTTVWFDQMIDIADTFFTKTLKQDAK